ncbi:MAG: hypothetical protein HQ591_13250 [candidate division Zixibacteria bacterium]|nr:hypothetical protein [Candidatus Tariuqbacter arcticus]
MSKRLLRNGLALTVAILLITVPVLSQVAYQPVGTSGGIDYGNRVIVTKGMGLPGGIGGRGGQIRAAIIDAQRNFLEVSKGAYVTSTSTVEGLILTGDVIESRVEGLVRNFTVTDTSYWDDGTIEITLEVRMDGANGFLDNVLPQKIGSAVIPSYEAPSVGGSVYTGLIVDARGLGIRPALAPKVVDTKGKEVYGSSYVSREYAIQQGMVGYEKTPEKAAANNRVAPSPLLVKGISAEGPNRTDVVIADQDAAALLSMSENLGFLRQCKVMIIVD